MIFALLFAYFGYKKANESNRSGIVWGLIALLAYIGTQFLIGLLTGVLLVFGEVFFGWSTNLIDGYEILINIVAILGGFTSGFIVLWYLGRRPEIEGQNEPPPPPEFKQG